MLPQILPQLLALPSRKHHVRHHQINSPLALFVNLRRLSRILGLENFKARVLQNAASHLPHKRLVLHQKNGSQPRPIVRIYIWLKTHIILQFTFLTPSSAIAWPCRFRNSERSAPTSLSFGRTFEISSGIYFKVVRIVCFGSSTIFRTSLGAISRNAVSRPTASTSPRKTSALPAVVAYTGTAVTRSSGTSFCKIMPVTVVTPVFSVM